jgi:hypothetical protein
LTMFVAEAERVFAVVLLYINGLYSFRE